MTVLFAAALVAADLLQTIAARYEQIIDYRVEVESKVTSLIGSDPATKRTFVLAASKPRMMFMREQVHAPIKYEVLFGTDGKTPWAYSPTLKRYALDQSEITAELRDQHFRYFRRFETVDRLGAKAEIGRKRGGCTSLHLSRDDWAEELCVNSSGLVVKSVFTKKSLVETLKTTTTWRFVQLDGELDPAIFHFVSPPDATRTNVIPAP